MSFLVHRRVQKQLKPGSSRVIRRLGSHLGRVIRLREPTARQKQVVPNHLSFLPHPNFPHPGLRSPGGGGHFKEAWLRNVEGKRKIRKGPSERKTEPFPPTAPSRVAAPGVPREKSWIQRPGRESKVAVPFQQWSEPPEWGPLSPKGVKTPFWANRVDPRFWVGGYYPESRRRELASAWFSSSGHAARGRPS